MGTVACPTEPYDITEPAWIPHSNTAPCAKTLGVIAEVEQPNWRHSGYPDFRWGYVCDKPKRVALNPNPPYHGEFIMDMSKLHRACQAELTLLISSFA